MDSEKVYLLCRVLSDVFVKTAIITDSPLGDQIRVAYIMISTTGPDCADTCNFITAHRHINHSLRPAANAFPECSAGTG